MTLHQILTCFLYAIKGSSLKSMAQQLKIPDYHSLIAFFHQTWEPQQLLKQAADQLLNLQSGYLALDEIVLEKHSVGKFWLVKHRYKSDGGYITPAISVVLLVWTNGLIRVPIRFELRRPGEGSVKDSAMRLLSWARNQAHLKPQYVLFDAGFASQELLKRIDDYGWMFVCRITKTRLFNDVPMWRYKKQGYWNEVGLLSSGLKVRAIRRANKFFVTNRVMIAANQVVAIYGKRHVIEEIFRILKQECHWDRCQLRCAEAYERFLSVGCLSFVKWESLRLSQLGFSTIYKLRRSVMFDHIKLDFSLPDSISVEVNL